MSAAFITFEGLDGSGKSTHLGRVARRLAARGVPHFVTHEPGGTELGRALRRVFLDGTWNIADGGVEALLLFADRRLHLLELIEPTLTAGSHVLCDRYTDSTLAYQGYGRGESIERLLELDRWATDGRRPDRTILFDLPPEIARDRGQSPKRQLAASVDRLDAEELEFYARVREGYLELAAAEPDRFRVVDSSGSSAETEKQVEAALADLLGTEE